MERLGPWEVPREIIDTFGFDARHARSEPLDGGHIHQSFLVTDQKVRRVFQRLNERVFPDLATMLSNVERIVAHLGGRGGPELVTTRDGHLSDQAGDGSWWRAFRYLDGTVGRTGPQKPADAFEAARAFALYVRTLATLPGPPLGETIKAFHGLEPRLALLDAAAHADCVGRRSAVHPDLDRARRLSRQVEEGLQRWEGLLPVRTVHNDAKLSNVRFDIDSGQATCVIDLDTTMPGQVQYDVGELVRTVTTHAPEDASEADIVDFDLELLEALSDGYLAHWPELESSEVEAMALAGPQMAVENALRFLTDHLEGDRYYAVTQPNQNIDRCRTQLRLAELMLDAQSEAAACFARSRLRSLHHYPEGRPGQVRP